MRSERHKKRIEKICVGGWKRKGDRYIKPPKHLQVCSIVCTVMCYDVMCYDMI